MSVFHTELFQSLKDRFYTTVPFLVERPVIEESVQAFFKFLEESEAVKSHIDFSIAPVHRRGDVGYRHREAADLEYNDSKDFFHYHPALFKHYPDFLEAHPVVKDFVTKAKPIWDHAAQTVSGILETLEQDFPGIHGKVFDTQGEIHLLLRFLKYEWNASEKYLAKPHFDAGSMTLALAESTPGLRIGSCPEDLTLVEHKPGNAIFMLASNFQKVMESDILSPGWHDVIQLDDTRIGKPYARWAVVAFIEAHGVEALSRAETHKYFTPNVA